MCYIGKLISSLWKTKSSTRYDTEYHLRPERNEILIVFLSLKFILPPSFGIPLRWVGSLINTVFATSKEGSNFNMHSRGLRVTYTWVRRLVSLMYLLMG